MLKLTLALLAVGASAIRVAEDEENCDEPWVYDECSELYYQYDCENYYEENILDMICNYIVSLDENGDDWWYEDCEDLEYDLTLCDEDW